MRTTRLMMILISVFFLFSAMPPAHAEGEPAKQLIQNFVKDITSMDFPVKDQAKHQKLVQDANAALDLDAMGKRSLDKHWAEAAPEDQKEFLSLLWKLIENVAYPRSHAFMGSYEITYPEIKADPKGFEVHSVVKQAEQALDAEVIYHVRPDGANWKVDDVILDGVSITEDLKFQFDKLIEKSGFKGLLDKMRERLAQAEKDNAQPAGAKAAA